MKALLGTMTFGDTVERELAGQMIDTAMDAGVAHIDTANVYSGGAAERMLGELLAGRRDSVFLATKVGMPHEDAGTDSPLSTPAIRRCVEGSLRRLSTDRVDLLYLHQPDRSTDLDETLGAVAELVSEGKVLALGLSNYSAWMTRDVVHHAGELGHQPPVVGQQLLNLVARRLEDEYLEMATSSGLSTYVYNPLSGGLLTGRHRFEDDPSDGRFGDSRLAPMYRQRYWTKMTFDALEALERIAEQAGLSLLELSMRWVAGHPGVDGVLVGASRLGHLTTNLELIAKGGLAVDVVTEIDKVGAALSGPMPPYHR